MILQSKKSNTDSIAEELKDLDNAGEWLDGYLTGKCGLSRAAAQAAFSRLTAFGEAEREEALNSVDWNEQAYRYAKFYHLVHLMNVLINYEKYDFAAWWEDARTCMENNMCFSKEEVDYAEEKVRMHCMTQEARRLGLEKGM